MTTTNNKNIIKNDKIIKLSKKLNFLNNKETDKKIDLKKFKNQKKEKITTTGIVKNNIRTKSSDTNKKNNIKINLDNNSIKLVNEIRNNEKLLGKIKYLQLWWKTIYNIIKIQKNIRRKLQRVKINKLRQLNKNIYLFCKPIKRIIFKKVFATMKKIKNKKLKITSPQKKKSIQKSNEFLNNDSFSFEKIFLTSRKTNEKQRPKIKQNNLKISNIKLPQNKSLTKRKNVPNKKEEKKENNKQSQNKQNNKNVCQCFKTSSNLITNKKTNNNYQNKNNPQVNKIEVSHKAANKTKKLIKYRNEVNNNLNKFKSYHPESQKNKGEIKGLSKTIKNNSSKKKNYELEYISSHDMRFHCPKTLFNSYEFNSKSNNKNIIRVQKKTYKNNINELNEEINNLRSRSLENRSSNKRYKSFINKINKEKKKNISGFIELNSNNDVKKDMINWLNLWERTSMNINKSSEKYNIKQISLFINKIYSYTYKLNGNILFNKLKELQKLKIIKSYFELYKNSIIIKKILEQLKAYQKAKIDEKKKEIEKLNKLKKLILKYTSLKRCFIKWKKLKNKSAKYFEEVHIKFNSNNAYDIEEYIDDSYNDFFNKSQPEINSLRINNPNSLRNKYNISNIKPKKDQNNNINININYNLISNNNSSEQGIYRKKKIKVPKTKNYQNKSCFIGENEQEDINNNTIYGQSNFMNNSMITKRIKIKKKENKNIYFPKHIKHNYIQSDIDYLAYKNNINRMQFSHNKNDMRNKKGVINKKINLKFQKIYDINNKF